MADQPPASPTPPPSPPPVDRAMARKAVRFLGRELRLSQYRLKRQIRVRKEAFHDEQVARTQTRRLVAKIAREFVRCPGLYHRGEDGRIGWTDDTNGG